MRLSLEKEEVYSENLHFPAEWRYILRFDFQGLLPSTEKPKATAVHLHACTLLEPRRPLDTVERRVAIWEYTLKVCLGVHKGTYYLGDKAEIKGAVLHKS